LPKIVRFGGISLSDDAVRIRDVVPSPPPRPEPEPDGEFEPLRFEDGEGEQAADGLETPPQAPDAGGGETDGESGGEMPCEIAREEIVSAAMAEAGRIIEDAVRQAEEKKADILATARFQADKLKREAAEEGRREGFVSVVGEMEQAARGIEKAVADFEGERAGFETEYEDHLRWLAIEIASKVLAKKVSDDDAEMAEMVQKAVQGVRNEPWIRVEVSQEMVHLIDRLSTLYDQSAGIEVSAIPAAAGTVHIETSSGVVDASLRTQLENLREYFAQTPPS
jgi:flagellar biosynthesis/type III secretory pathway protein FliH